jgi:hypothetical protein
MKSVLALMLFAASTAWAADGNHRGLFYWGHEVESFQPCGSKKSFWVEGDEKTLQPLRDRTEKLRKERGKPYQPIYVEAAGLFETKSKREGFAESYDGLFRLHKVARVSALVPKGCVK